MQRSATALGERLSARGSYARNWGWCLYTGALPLRGTLEKEADRIAPQCHPVERGYGGPRLTTDLNMPEYDPQKDFSWSLSSIARRRRGGGWKIWIDPRGRDGSAVS